MSAAAERSGFATRAVLLLIAVGVVALAAMAVLSAYAPQLRSGGSGGHALSSSAVGFRGAVVMSRALGRRVAVSRAPPKPAWVRRAHLVLTPGPFTPASRIEPFGQARTLLIVLPKWEVSPSTTRPGFVEKAGVRPGTREITAMLKGVSKRTTIAHRADVHRPALRGVVGSPAEGLYLRPGAVDRLQTLDGPGLSPMLEDERGAVVMAHVMGNSNIMVLADPDLLNTQGLKSLETARVGMTILRLAQGTANAPLTFDVTLNGIQADRSFSRMMLEPPWLAATLCAVAAALLVAWQGLARFGPVRPRQRAIALGSAALVDNSAGLVRMARREAEMAPAYLAVIRRLVEAARGARGERDPAKGLERLARQRGAADPGALAAEAAALKTREEALAFALKLQDWKTEMTVERR